MSNNCVICQDVGNAYGKSFAYRLLFADGTLFVCGELENIYSILLDAHDGDLIELRKLFRVLVRELRLLHMLLEYLGYPSDKVKKCYSTSTPSLRFTRVSTVPFLIARVATAERLVERLYVSALVLHDFLDELFFVMSIEYNLFYCAYHGDQTKKLPIPDILCSLD